jgi:hypothetical protein
VVGDGEGAIDAVIIWFIAFICDMTDQALHIPVFRIPIDERRIDTGVEVTYE